MCCAVPLRFHRDLLLPVLHHSYLSCMCDWRGAVKQKCVCFINHVFAVFSQPPIMHVTLCSCRWHRSNYWSLTNWEPSLQGQLNSLRQLRRALLSLSGKLRRAQVIIPKKSESHLTATNAFAPPSTIRLTKRLKQRVLLGQYFDHQIITFINK